MEYGSTPYYVGLTPKKWPPYISATFVLFLVLNFEN